MILDHNCTHEEAIVFSWPAVYMYLERGWRTLTTVAVHLPEVTKCILGLYLSWVVIQHFKVILYKKTNCNCKTSLINGFLRIKNLTDIISGTQISCCMVRTGCQALDIIYARVTQKRSCTTLLVVLAHIPKLFLIKINGIRIFTSLRVTFSR